MTNPATVVAATLLHEGRGDGCLLSLMRTPGDQLASLSEQWPLDLRFPFSTGETAISPGTEVCLCGVARRGDGGGSAAVDETGLLNEAQLPSVPPFGDRLSPGTSTQELWAAVQRAIGGCALGNEGSLPDGP